MKTVVFACVHNAGRSQMAAAFFNALADPSRARAVSAGTQPGTRVHPEVVDAMREVGLDLSAAQPRLLTDALARGAALLVTMGCGDACPYVPGLKRDDWPLPDPKGKPIAEVRAIRDDVKRRVRALLTAEGWSRIRPAAAEDLPEVRALLRAYEAAIGVSLCFQSFEEELAGLPGAYAPPAGRLLLAREGNALAGCVALRALEPGIAEMKRLFVLPEHAGHGLGRALAEAIVDEARAAGYRTMRLDTLPTMTRAHALYRSLGFREVPAFNGNPVEGTLYFERSLHHDA